MKDNNTKFDKRFMVNLSKATTALVVQSALLAAPVLITPEFNNYLLATGFMAMLGAGIPYAANGYKDWKSVGRVYAKKYDDVATWIRNMARKEKTK